MANRRYQSQFLQTFETQQVLLECNFLVDPLNPNGMGTSLLKGAGIAAVYMNVQGAGPAGTPAMGSARTFAILGASAVSNTGSSVLSGDLGIYPNGPSSVTGFPPGTYSGALHAADTVAQQAQASALAAYTDLQARVATVIPTELGGQSLAPGVYRAASGTFTLNGTLTLTGPASSLYVFQTATTLVTGASSTPVIALGSVLPSNIYWAIGSSATINSGNAGTFSGNVIAQASITDTLGGTVNGTLVALTGAVTLSAASLINVQTLAPSFVAPGNPNPAPGYIMVQFTDVYSRYLAGFSGFASGAGGVISNIGGTALTQGKAYFVNSVGTSTQADWTAVGLPAGVVPVRGMPFIAATTGAGSGSGTARTDSVSGIGSIETLAVPNLSVSAMAKLPASSVQPIGQTVGGYIILICLDAPGTAPVPPATFSTVYLNFLLSNSSVTIKGQ